VTASYEFILFVFVVVQRLWFTPKHVAGLPEAPKQDCGSLRGGGFCLPQQVPVYPPLLEM
jgi:hypothetical protein